MKIIGERINDTRTQVKRAVSERDVAFIQGLAQRQVQAGAHWLDVSAGAFPQRELENLVWLVQTVQEAVDVPLCLDSASAPALAAAIKHVRQTPLINSISGEPQRLEGILPLVADHGCPVIALAMDEKGIPETYKGRMEVVRKVMEAARASGVPDGNVYVDPLAMALAANTDSALITLDTMRAIRREFPKARLTMGLSNISFGLPARSYINRAFLTLALAAGLDSAILDPLDHELKAALVSARLVLGHDRHCLNYTRAYRAGLFRGPGAKATHK